MAFHVKDLLVTLEPSRHACPTASADTQCPTASATLAPWLLTCPGQSQNQGGCPAPSSFDGPAHVDQLSLLRHQLAERLN